MTSLLNTERPPVFCPGCAHDRIARTLDRALVDLALPGNRVAMVSDIGCSGLFDTFFHTHALHGLHGRALTYATGLKMARPDLTVVVTMGDGGQGIGGAHLLAACRRNLDLTLLVLNNFNFGMTGGQFSATTPPDARLGSGFLNRLERPLDVCTVARTAGAPYVARVSAYSRDLAGAISRAIAYRGFSLVDIWGICPGRYTKRNRLTPARIEEEMAALPPAEGEAPENRRPEYGEHYRSTAKELGPPPGPIRVEARHRPPEPGRCDVILLGSAGQRVLTAGELLCLAGMSGGLLASQKNEYNITVLRGPSISEIILSPDPVDYAGIETPSVVLALAPEGVARRPHLFAELGPDTLVIRDSGVELPPCRARIHDVNFKAQGVKAPDASLAALAVMAKLGEVIHLEMLRDALALRFRKSILEPAMSLVERVSP